MLNAALTIIGDEHRSIATVVAGMRFLLRDVMERDASPDFRLLWAMIHYMDAFPERFHHPKENAYLFERLRARTNEADQVIAELERQHEDGGRRLRELEQALGCYEAGLGDGLRDFAAAVETFSAEVSAHLAMEEEVVLPLARKHLTAEDWVTIAEAFGSNGDPRFGSEPDREFRQLFATIAGLVPPATIT